eukprot:gene10291-10450_t
MAYHGTNFANLHSILHNGLLAASGTRLQTSGAAFGSGIYLSTDFDVAYAFSKGAEAWQSSCIGRQLRCVLLCDVDPEAAVHGALRPAQMQLGVQQHSLPDKYILVPRPQDVVPRYLLIFCDDAMLGLPPVAAAAAVAAATSPGHERGRRHQGAAVCLYVTAAYLGLILLLSAWGSSSSSSSSWQW